MTTKREYAASLGLAIAGARGRMSREANAAIDKARSEGTVFSDDGPVVKVTPKAPKAPSRAPKAVLVKTGPVVETSTTVMGDVFLRYESDQLFKGVDSNGKEHKNINTAQACYTCGYSLLGHTCNEPKVLIGSPLEWIAVVTQ